MSKLVVEGFEPPCVRWNADRSGDIQRAEIDFHRNILQCRPVALSEMPRWLMERICWLRGGWGRSAAHIGMQWLAGKCGDRGQAFIDHWGKARCSDSDAWAFVTEPYMPKSEAIAFASKFALALGVHWRVGSVWESWWYPGQTRRVEFWECISDPTCHGCVNRSEAKMRCKAIRKRFNL